MKAATPRRSHAERSAATQAQVLDAAARVVLTKSFQAATMFEVAKEAGVTPGALQHHFGSKAELMLQLLERQLHAEGDEALAWPEATLPLPQRALALVQTLWRGLYEPPRFLVAWGVYFGSVGDEALRERIAIWRERLQHTLHQHFMSSLPELVHTIDAPAFIDMVVSCLRGMAVVRLFATQTESSAAQLRALAQVIEQRCAVATVTPGSAGPARRQTVSQKTATRKTASPKAASSQRAETTKTASPKTTQATPRKTTAGSIAPRKTAR